MAINKDKVRAAAQKFLQKGQIDKAIREFERIVEDDPRDVRTLLKIGDLQTRAGQNGDASKTYAKVAVFYSEQGFFLKAVAVYKQILKIDPALIDVNQKLAELYQQLGLVSDAVAQHRQIAAIYEQQGQLEASSKVVETMISLDPENIASRVKLAELQGSRGLLDEAKKSFQRVAATLKSQDRIDDYMKVAERIVHFDNTDLAAARELATLYLQRDDARRALAKLQICFKADPRDVTTLELLATAFHKLGQVPKTVSVYRELAHVHRDAGRTEAYHEALRKIARLVPGDEEAQSVLSAKTTSVPAASAPMVETLTPTWEAPAPVASPTPVVRPSPAAAPGPAPSRDASSVAKILAEADVYIKYGLREKAIDHLLRAIELGPEPREARQRLRLLYEEGENIDAAVEQLWQMAQACIANDEPAQALTDLQELLSLQPDHSRAVGLLAMLGSDESTPTPAPRIPAAPMPPVTVRAPVPTAATALYRDERPVEADAVDIASELDLDVDVDVDVDVDTALPEPEDEEPTPLAAQAPRAEEFDEALEETLDETPEALLGLSESLPDLSDEIEEVEFFRQQGLEAEARDALAHLLDRYPMHPGLLALNTSVLPEPDSEAVVVLEPVPEPATTEFGEADLDWDDAPAGVAPPEPVAPAVPLAPVIASEPRPALIDDEEPEPERVQVAPDSGFVELEAELAGELADFTDDEGAAAVADVFEQFKRGVAQQVEDTDYDTHYNLGIAYKEMGLFADAIRELQIARNADDKLVGAMTLIGLCELEQGDAQAAVASFRLLLDRGGLSAPEITALRYELGRAYQAAGQSTEAASLLEQVCNTDPAFRDAAIRLAELRAPGGPVTVPAGGNGTRNGKISYV
ncbi:MAG: tetratricopeptide repeat protein [Myxococcota bacterium]